MEEMKKNVWLECTLGVATLCASQNELAIPQSRGTWPLQ